MRQLDSADAVRFTLLASGGGLRRRESGGREMAERRKPRKRNAGPAREPKRLSLLDLPPALEPRVEPPTQVAHAAPPPKRTTLLPAAAESMDDVSLASLARAARRSSGPPEPLPTRRAAPTRSRGSLPPEAPVAIAPQSIAAHHVVESEKLVAESAASARGVSSPPAALSVAPPATHSVAPPALRTEPSPALNLASTLPPPVQMPSEPPRVHIARGGAAWFRTLGVIVLSASVGALVSSTIWGVKSELLEAKHRDAASEETRTATAAPAASCAPATAGAMEPKSAPAHVRAAVATATGPATEAPRIAFDALPLQSDKRREVTPERISLDALASEPVSRAGTETPRASRRASRDAAPRSNRERRSASPAPAPAPAELPVAPSRDAVSQAVGRAASAAATCDSGPNDGKVAVTFAPSGAVQSVSLVKGFGDASVNGCVLRAFGRARVPAFSGEPVVARKSLAW
jgi:hypothetical protein